MTTTSTDIDTAPTAVETAYGMAERILAALNALTDHDITPAAVSVSGHEVSIQISSWRRGDAAPADVDTLATQWGLAAADAGSVNYTRSGDTTIYGIPMTLIVYTGRSR